MQLHKLLVPQNQRVPANYNASNRYAKGKRVTANVFADPNMGETDTFHATCNANLTNEQCGQLISLLQHLQLGKTGDRNTDEKITCGAANFAGIVACHSSTDFNILSRGCLKSRNDLWILDSGATHHMTFTRNNFFNITTLPFPLLVKLPNGYNVKVTEI